MVEEINGRYFPPSAAQTTPIDVGARGQATPEVTNSAISTRAQRVPSTPMPSGANATPTRTDGYSPASTAALRSMQQSPVAEQQAWDAEKMTAAANANLDEMQTMYKQKSVTPYFTLRYWAVGGRVTSSADVLTEDAGAGSAGSAAARTRSAFRACTPIKPSSML